MLRPLTEAEVPTVGGWLADRTLADAYVATEEELGAEEVEGALELAREVESVGAWAIDHRDGGLIASSYTKPDFPWEAVHECEVTLSPELPKRQGYGLEAHQLVVDHVFRSRPEVVKVMGRAAGFNAAAIRIMEKLDARREGTLRHHIELRGERFDLAIYGLLREEWEQTGADQRRVPLPAL
ncbi:MAG: GNAT family N-acetyltransferase [Thermoleophilaceae bacterium]